jgi:hypothetical protein
VAGGIAKREAPARVSVTRSRSGDGSRPIDGSDLGGVRALLEPGVIRLRRTAQHSNKEESLMMTKMSKVTRLFARGLTAASLSAAVSIFANACADDSARIVSNVGQTGRVELNLLAVSGTQQVYRLRNASFTITARATGAALTASTEDNPNGSSLLVELVPDTYEVYLQPGYYLELLQGGLPVSARRAPERAPGARSTVSAREAGVNGVDAGAPLPPSDPSEAVDAELISANPGVVTVAADAVSAMSFVFRVGGSALETGRGVLDIGLEVIDTERECVPDAFEPNEDSATATPIAAGTRVSATLCVADIDVYTFPAPVAEGEFFSVRLGFSASSGDIFAYLLEAGTGSLAGVSVTTESGAIVSGVSNGGAYELWAQPGFIDGSGTSYSIDIGAFVPPANGCCEVGTGPGCREPDVLECVCELDDFCCLFYDEICAATAAAECGATCNNDAAESDCCTTSEGPGCTNDVVHTCVCGTDFSCCSVSFDELCVASAIAECGAQCSLPPPASDCCSASSAPGCTVPSVQECVCSVDPYCCAGSFDENCAVIAQDPCGAVCLE